MFLARRAVFIQLRPSDLQLVYGLFIVGLLVYTRVREDSRRKSADFQAVRRIQGDSVVGGSSSRKNGEL